MWLRSLKVTFLSLPSSFHRRGRLLLLELLELDDRLLERLVLPLELLELRDRLDFFERFLPFFLEDFRLFFFLSFFDFLESFLASFLEESALYSLACFKQLGQRLFGLRIPRMTPVCCRSPRSLRWPVGLLSTTMAAQRL